MTFYRENIPEGITLQLWKRRGRKRMVIMMTILFENKKIVVNDLPRNAEKELDSALERVMLITKERIVSVKTYAMLISEAMFGLVPDIEEENLKKILEGKLDFPERIKKRKKRKEAKINMGTMKEAFFKLNIVQ